MSDGGAPEPERKILEEEPPEPSFFIGGPEEEQKEDEARSLKQVKPDKRRLSELSTQPLNRVFQDDEDLTIVVAPAFSVRGRPMFVLTRGDDMDLETYTYKLPRQHNVDVVSLAAQILPDVETSRADLEKALLASRLVEKRFVLLPIGMFPALRSGLRLAESGKAPPESLVSSAIFSAMKEELMHHRTRVIGALMFGIVATLGGTAMYAARRSNRRNNEYASGAKKQVKSPSLEVYI